MYFEIIFVLKAPYDECSRSFTCEVPSVSEEKLELEVKTLSPGEPIETKLREPIMTESREPAEKTSVELGCEPTVSDIAGGKRQVTNHDAMSRVSEPDSAKRQSTSTTLNLTNHLLFELD